MAGVEARIEAALQTLQARGEIEAWLLEELERIAASFPRRANLPTSLSPYGGWDEEAAAEIYQGWMEGRLLRGGLLKLLGTATSVESLRRLSGRSLRQWLLNQRTRSHSQNLYRRLRKLLEDDEGFVLREEAARVQDRAWTTAALPAAPRISPTDRELLGWAWGLGDFELLRFSEKERLSPLLSADDLRRFALGLLEASGGALTLTSIMLALRLRFQLDDPEFERLDDASVGAARFPAPDSVGLRESALAVIAEMTSRQADVTLGSRAGESLEELAAKHGCSLSTVHNEQARVRGIILRYSDGDAESHRLLTVVGDLLFESSNAESE